VAEPSLDPGGGQASGSPVAIEPATGAGSADRAPGDRAPGARSPGLREALLVGELVVVVVLLAGVATFLLPGDGRDVVLRTPLLILVLIVGTAAVLWRISRPGRPEQ
jgi:hypothetical protein